MASADRATVSVKFDIGGNAAIVIVAALVALTIAATVRCEEAPSHPAPTWAELVAMPGVEAEIRARLEAAESCERERVACSEAADALRLSALADADVIAQQAAQIIELKQQVKELRESKGVECPPQRKRWPAFAAGCIVGAGVGVAVYEVEP